jgi:hypothetical protein
MSHLFYAFLYSLWTCDSSSGSEVVIAVHR